MADMIVGILGAFIGSYLFTVIGIGTFGLIGELVASFIGSVILVSTIKMFSGSPTENE